MFGRKTVDKVESMLNAALAGTFRESDYDETQLSRVECKWKQFFRQSALSKENLEKERDNIKGLVSDISHQTKTPVANIQLYTELLMEELDKKEDSQDLPAQRKLTEEISRQTAKLDFLVRALTKLSRLESGTVEVSPKRQEIWTLIEEAADGILPGAEKKQIRLEFDRENSCEVCYDLKWSKEALFNILDNAVKYSNTGGCITICVRNYEMYGAISVKDDGIGIREEDTARIFGRFYRAKEVQQEEGVGIGLYLAREIMRKQQGYIQVKSSPGRGSEFILFFIKNRI